ncbi:MAG: sugar nucleotidyltransferase [Planctomycetes bacterium B3_Pla]|nr:MAG: sugar nucleotidyltransferase [Planctomycetes bacterium B3_Pla]
MFNVRQAVILAAGVGSRLKGTLDDRPKGFIKLGERAIIEESIAKLIHANITDIVIVTGYCPEFYERLSEKFAVIRTIWNPDFAGSGSMRSFCVASPYINSDFLLLESDLSYEYKALQTLQSSSLGSCILLSGETGSGDEVYVGISGQRVVNMSKKRSDITCLGGELVGISKISQELYRRMINICPKKCKHNRQYHYEDCLTDISDDIAIRYHYIEDLAWTEIDDENQLTRAQEKIYPLIKQRDSGITVAKKGNRYVLLNTGHTATTDTVTQVTFDKAI